MAVIVITGGTAGVGKATALHFAKAGYDVGIIARDEQSLRSTEEELRRFGINACAVQADVADSKAVTDAANEIEYRLGAIDVWVNNAMGGMLAPFRTMSPEEFRRVTEVTYLGYVNGTRAALELMTPRDRGDDYSGWLRAGLPLHSLAVSLLWGEGRDPRVYRRRAHRADA